MYQVIIVIHVLLGLGVIALVLMQQGKGADAGAAFGTGSAGSVFGAQGAASFLSRSTAILATLFFATSLGLAVVNGHRDSARDIMANPATDTGLPAVENAKPMDMPPPVTAPNNPPTDVLPPVPVPAVVAPQATEVPVKAEAIDAPKTIEPAKAAQPAAAEEKKATQKPAVKEHKPAATTKDKKAEPKKSKEVKKDH